MPWAVTRGAAALLTSLLREGDGPSRSGVASSRSRSGVAGVVSRSSRRQGGKKMVRAFSNLFIFDFAAALTPPSLLPSTKGPQEAGRHRREAGAGRRGRVQLKKLS